MTSTFVVSIGVEELVDQVVAKRLVVDATELLHVDLVLCQSFAHVRDTPFFGRMFCGVDRSNCWSDQLRKSIIVLVFGDQLQILFY